MRIKQSEFKEGDQIRIRRYCACVDRKTIYVLKVDKDGFPYVDCKQGKHLLGVTVEEFLKGIVKA